MLEMEVMSTVQDSAATPVHLRGVVIGNANLRLKESSNSAIIRLLPVNHHVMILGTNTNGSRTKVRDGDTVGWIGSKYVEPFQQQGIIKEKSAIVRQGSKTTSTKLFTLKRNHLVQILGINEKGNRTQIRDSSSGKIGWVNTNRIDSFEAKRTITAASAIFRKGMKTNTAEIGRLSRNSHIEVLGTNRARTRVLVRSGNKIGWIGSGRSKAFRVQGRITSEAVFRRGIGLTTPKIATLPVNANPTILGRSGNRTKIRINGKTGWINTNQVVTFAQPRVVTSSSVVFREGISTTDAKSPRITTLSVNTPVEVLGMNPSGKRVQIRHGGRIGWIPSGTTKVGVSSTGFIRPMKRAIITCRWGCYSGHAGIDMAESGSPLILAAASGTVTQVISSNVGYGNYVVIRHNINGRTYYTLYAHMSSTLVQVGNQVSQSQAIGNQGNTGNSTGPHLHFEIHRDSFGNRINPEMYINFPSSW